MIIVLCLRWWYSAGWQWAWRRMVADKVQWILEAFSTTDMMRTLFAPYRQTFAGNVNGSIGDHLRGLVDNFISRVIGMLVRLFLIIISAGFVLVVFLFGTVFLVLWPLIPFLPVISILLFVGGVGL